jgi:16S rRNA (uracil1498-N3)-methyltransferase
MRLKNNDNIRVFNEQMGEFDAVIRITCSNVSIVPSICVREPEPVSQETWLAFCPIKPHLTHFIIEKSTELGVTHFQPIFSEYTQFRSLNVAKLRKIAIEATEQCGRLDVPMLFEGQTFAKFTDSIPDLQSVTKTSVLPMHWLAAIERCGTNASPLVAQDGPAGIIIGPEGGFSEREKSILNEKARVVTLGKNILRSETAAICAISRLRQGKVCVQNVDSCCTMRHSVEIRDKQGVYVKDN